MRSRAVVFRQVSLGLAVYGPEAGPQGSSRALGQTGTPGPCAVVFRQVSFELVACGCLRPKTEHDKQYFLSVPLLCLWKP